MDDVAHWLTKLKEGDSIAAQALWERYYADLVGVARKKLGQAPRRDVDEDDIAQSAFKSFYKGVEQGRFPQLEDGDDLWKLLFTITARKAAAHHKRRFAQKRGAGRVQGESYFGNRNEVRDAGIEQVVGGDPSPETVAIIGEAINDLLAALPDDSLRNIASLKMAGYTNNEIAEQLGRVPRTVERKLELIRSTWKQQTSDNTPDT